MAGAVVSMTLQEAGDAPAVGTKATAGTAATQTATVSTSPLRDATDLAALAAILW